MSTIDRLFQAGTYTLNKALTHASTDNAVLDFFSRAGGMRGKPSEVTQLFAKAYNENPRLARKALFWLRDVRGGAGERELFRSCLVWLATHDRVSRMALLANMPNIAEYGRYDDLLVLLDVESVAYDVASFLLPQLQLDLKSERPSLLAKWLPSENASSKTSRNRARILMRHWGMSPRDYRRNLSTLRSRLNVLETRMSKKQYANIRYDTVPSQAMRIHGRKGKAFLRNDETRFSNYLAQVERGTKTIKAGTLYPYQLVKQYLNNPRNQVDATIEAQWKALPDYLATNPHNGLVVCDVSGSMNGGINSSIRPIDISISLAIYFSERCKGIAHNRFITFSDDPQLEVLRGNTLHEKVNNLSRANWDMSTNIQKVFDVLLDNAIRYQYPQSDMPDVIYIVSDMEFNQATGRNNRTNLDVIRQKYAQAGYKAPLLVFWNVNAKTNQSPAKQSEPGVVLISGASPAIVKALLSEGVKALLDMTPTLAMVQVLNSERYELVI